MSKNRDSYYQFTYNQKYRSENRLYYQEYSKNYNLKHKDELTEYRKNYIKQKKYLKNNKDPIIEISNEPKKIYFS
jgi:hypothetical protein